MEQRFAGVVAIDGPSASGKSTVARQLATSLYAHYLDTGSMYRAITWAVLQAGVDPHDSAAVIKTLESRTLRVGTEPTAPTIAVNDRRIDVEIRGAPVTAAVSAVAAIPEVRRALVAQQQKIITAACTPSDAAMLGVVVEGRDIGTVVAPDAVVKIYLTAHASVRAERRHAETAGDVSADTAQDLHRRDTWDSNRATDPLRVADDAVIVDTSDMSIDEVVSQLLTLVHSRLGVA